MNPLRLFHSLSSSRKKLLLVVAGILIVAQTLFVINPKVDESPQGIVKAKSPELAHSIEKTIVENVIIQPPSESTITILNPDEIDGQTKKLATGKFDSLDIFKVSELLDLIQNKEEVFNKVDKRILFNRFIQKMLPPPKEKTVWATPEPGKRLSIAIVDPREHENFQGALYNLAHIFGGSDVSLYVFHGNKNKEFLENIMKDWKNVQYINTKVDKSSRGGYNHLMVSADFYKNFVTEFVLITQVDVIIRREIDEEMFNYDYVGAPWGHRPIPERESQVGNGGFSLRNVKAMLEIIAKGDKLQENEDTYLARRTKKGKLPSEEVAKKFSIEMYTADNPTGMHQVYNYIDVKEIIRLCLNLPGLPKVYERPAKS